MAGRKGGGQEGREEEQEGRRAGQGRAGVPCDQGTFPRLGCTASP